MSESDRESRIVEPVKLIDAPSAEAELVQDRSKAGGPLGVSIKGAKFVVKLPAAFGERTQLCDFFGFVIAAHPDHAPLLIDGDTGTYREVDFARLQQECREARALTRQ